MSGGQDDASNDIESSGIVDKHRGVIWSRDSGAELRRLLEACRGNSVLESQLKERIEQQSKIERELCEGMDELVDTLKKENDASEQIGSSGELPSFAELLDMSSEPCLWFQEDEDAEDARDAKAAIEEGGYVPYEEFRKTLKKENDAMERDARGPAIVSVGSVNTGLKFYGPFVSIEDAVAWLHDCGLTGATTVSLLESPRKANTTTPQYESHTMESLLPLAGEWVRANESDAVVRIGSMTPKSVWMMGFRPSEWTYDELRTVFTWATGPHAGKPVAREVG